MKKEPALISTLQKVSMDKGRTKFFLSFLLLSFFFWFITKFSKEYTEVMQFQLELSDLPASITPISNRELQIEVTLKASGFQFLYYQLVDSSLYVDMKNTSFEDGMATLPLAGQFQGLQEQLLGDTQILNFFPSTLEFDYQIQASKRIPVLAPDFDMTIGYAVTAVRFSPDSIDLIGPQEVIKNINAYTPNYVSSQKIRTNIEQYITVAPLTEQAIFEQNRILMKVEVDRFSERSFLLPIETENLPSDKVYKFFPNHVTVTFLAPLKQLKNIRQEDFKFGVNPNDINIDNTKIQLEVLNAPENIIKLRWEPKEVDYLLRQ